MQKAGQDWKGLDDVSIVRIQGVNGRPNQASVDIGIEAANDAQFGLIKRFLQPGALGDAFAKQGLERPSDLKLVTLPNAFTPGCARCMGTSPYVDGDDLGKDHVGNTRPSMSLCRATRPRMCTASTPTSPSASVTMTVAERDECCASWERGEESCRAVLAASATQDVCFFVT